MRSFTKYPITASSKVEDAGMILELFGDAVGEVQLPEGFVWDYKIDKLENGDPAGQCFIMTEDNQPVAFFTFSLMKNGKPLKITRDKRDAYLCNQLASKLQKEVDKLGDLTKYASAPKSKTIILSSEIQRDDHMRRTFTKYPISASTSDNVYYWNGVDQVPKDVVNVVIEDGVDKIPSRTFRKCEKLTHIDISNTVEYIGEWAFFGCISLKDIYIPPTVKFISPDAFAWCTNLVKVDISKSTEVSKHAFFQTPLDENFNFDNSKKTYTFKICDGASSYSRSSEVKDTFYESDYQLDTDKDAIELAIYMNTMHNFDPSDDEINYAVNYYLDEIGVDIENISLDKLIELAFDVDIGSGDEFVDSVYCGDREIFDQGLEAAFEQDWIESHPDEYDEDY